MDQEHLHRAFLSELESLEAFRIAYTAQFPDAPLSHDDPDVRRLIEALAFFTARTRMAAERGLDDSIQRIFRQHFPFLLAPVPALAMLRAAPTPAFADASELPAGAVVAVHEEPGLNGEPGERFFFRTLAPLRVLPLSLLSVNTVSRGSAYRILIRLQANSPSNQELNSLALHINHLDDLPSSIMVFQRLREHIREARVLYGADARQEDLGQRIDLTFGSPVEGDATPEPYLHPLQRARMQLRFPRSELYLRFSGFHPPRNWQSITLCLDLDENWPRKLRLTSDGFQLYAVPMMNVMRELADPLDVDGTRDRYVLQHPDAAAGFVVLWAMAALRPTKQGFVPLEPAVFGARGDCFEAWAEGQGASRRGYASFRLEKAYEKPERISVDAFWHQPGLSASDSAGWKLSLQERFIDGVTWNLSGPIVPSAHSWMDGDREAQLELLSMKTMRTLGRNELLLLLSACGAREEMLYAKLFRALDEVRTRAVPQGRSPGRLTPVYELVFRNLENADLPRLALFREWVAQLLGSWCEEAPNVVAVVPELGVQIPTVPDLEGGA